MDGARDFRYTLKTLEDWGFCLRMSTRVPLHQYSTTNSYTSLPLF